jgi:hypothetical protein
MINEPDTEHQPTRQALAIEGRSGRMQVTGKLKKALDFMLEGLPRAEAAAKAGIKDHSLREALRKPHVKRYYLDELDVLRTGERVRNFLALCEVRDQKSNAMARVNAVAALEAIADQQVAGSAHRQSPGVTIIIEAPRDARSLQPSANDIVISQGVKSE